MQGGKKARGAVTRLSPGTEAEALVGRYQDYQPPARPKQLKSLQITWSRPIGSGLRGGCGRRGRALQCRPAAERSCPNPPSLCREGRVMEGTGLGQSPQRWGKGWPPEPGTRRALLAAEASTPWSLQSQWGWLGTSSPWTLQPKHSFAALRASKTVCFFAGSLG